MVVCYFNVIGVSVFPTKADPPLIVDPDTVLPFAVSLQGFQPVPRRNAKVLKVPGQVKIQEPPPCNAFDRTKPRYVQIIEQRPCFGVAEGPDHEL
jgi:hypothetical protein